MVLVQMPQLSLLVLLSLLAYLTLVLLIGLLTSQRSGRDRDYFLANRSLNIFSSFVSVAATETSVATVLIFPQIGFRGGLELLWLPLGYIAGRAIVARFYLKDIYEQHSLSIYATVASAVRTLSSFYLLSKFISSGVRFFLACFALQTMFGGELLLWIAIMATVTGLYSLTGGLKAVVWTDQLQGMVILVSGIALALFLLSSGGEEIPFPSGRDLINLDASIGNSLFSPALFFGGLVLSIGTHGADQDMLQRVLATKSLTAARRSLLLSGLGAGVVIMLYLLIGYLLQYSEAGKAGNLSAETPLIDWLKQNDLALLNGAFALLLLAAAMSTLDSAMHSTGAVWKAVVSAGKSSNSSNSASSWRQRGRLYSFLSLLLLSLFAGLALILKEEAPDLLDLALGSMNYVNGGLIALFTLYIFAPAPASPGPASDSLSDSTASSDSVAGDRSEPAGKGGHPKRADSEQKSKQKLDAITILAAMISGAAVAIYANWLLEPRPAWPWITIASAAVALLAAILARSLSTDRGARAGEQPAASI